MTRSAAAGRAASSSRRILTLQEFSREAVAAAKASATGRFGDNKVFISHAFEALKGHPDFKGMGLSEFKGKLAQANTARHLDLARADLVDSKDIKDIIASETAHFGATYHFIRFKP